MKTLRYLIEAGFLYFIFFVFGLMPARTASNVGGWIGQTIGPRLGASKKVLRNLKMALPDLDDTSYARIIAAMWDNLGRVIAEYPHLENLCKDHTQIEGLDIFERAIKEHGSAIFIGGHLANWEINCAAALLQVDHPVDITYRAPNNPWSDALLQKARTLNGRLNAHAKSAEGGRGVMEAVKNGRSVGILIDQKYNEGVDIPFFGHPAMTNPIAVKLAQKYNRPLIPIRNIRTGPAQFTLKVEKPLNLFDQDQKPLPVEDVLKEAHMVLEGWIKDHPGQWLWLHKRWDSKRGEEA